MVEAGIYIYIYIHTSSVNEYNLLHIFQFIIY